MIDLPKKIIILGPAWPFRGGLATYNERLAKEFISQGIQCELVTFTTQYPSILFPGKTQFADETSSELIPLRKLSSINPLTWVKTANYINSQEPDLVITRFWLPFMGPSFGTVIRLLNKQIKILCLLDNVVPHEKRIGDTPFTNYFLKPIHSFIAMSKAVQEELLKLKPQANCILSPHPVFDNFGEKVDQQLAKKELDLDPNTKYVLFFGFIRKYKGLDLALKAFAKWKKEIPNTKLLVAGEFYDSKEQYFELAKELGIENEVIWHTDFIADSKVKFYFSAVNLLLQPYYSATQSGVTQIAYQFELPMIVTNVGGLPELVEHDKTGYLTETNAESISNYVVKFFNKERNSWDTEMKVAKKRFSWETLTKNMIQLYHKTN